MIPNNSLSSLPIVAPYLEKYNDPRAPLVDYEMGGVALSDPSQGLFVKVWTAYVEGINVMIKADDVAPSLLFSAPNISELSLAFDQNMRPAIAYMQGGASFLWWFDTTIPGNDTIAFGSDTKFPKITLDDKRTEALPFSDIILAYIKNNNLYFRAQRDRFLDEYLLKTDVNGRLLTIGMAKNNRLKFKLETISG